MAVFALVAKNLVRGRVGRSWMAIRDRDIAAEIIGVRPLRTKLLAFAISSFYCGVAGAEYVFLYLGSAETLAFDINVSFLVLFMVIIGGLGSHPRIVPGGRLHRDGADLPHQRAPPAGPRHCRWPCRSRSS